MVKKEKEPEYPSHHCLGQEDVRFLHFIWTALSPLFFFFLPLLSKQWSFIHYSAIRDCQDFLAVELESSSISFKTWKNAFAKLLEREMKKDIHSYNIINPVSVSPRELT